MTKSIKTRSGRILRLPTNEEDARIRAGIAGDPDTHEVDDGEFKLMRRSGRPLSESGGASTSSTELINRDLMPMERSTDAGEHRYAQRCGCTSEWCSSDEDEYVTLTIPQPQTVIK